MLHITIMPAKVRIVAKQIEKKLIKTAKDIKKNPLMLVPDCDSSCRSCPFKKLKKEMAKLKVQSHVEKMAKKNGIVAAAAATILLSNQKIQYAAYMKIGDENVYFAKRGKISDELLVGIQNWDKPNLRLLAYLDIAKKKKLNIYSTPTKLICSDNVPSEFLTYFNTLFICHEEEYVSINWNHLKIRGCGKRNTLVDMRQYFYSPDFENNVIVDVFIPDLICKSNCDVCIKNKIENYDIDLTDYLTGKVSDKQLISNYKKKRLWTLENKKIFIISNTCYGDNKNDFLQALKPKDWEKEALVEILNNEKKAILLENPSSTKLLENYGVDVIKLEKEFYDKKGKKILENLPEINGNTIAKFIDRLSRIHRIEGKEGVLKVIKDKKLLSIKEKTISYGFLVAMNVKGEEWKYSKMEIEFGSHLAEYIKKLLKSEGDSYKKTLITIVKEVG